MAGNKFAGDSWKYIIIEEERDADFDGLKDDIEVNILLTNPLVNDTDKDTMPDGFEATTDCLDPMTNDSHLMDITGDIINDKPRDQDGDGISSIDEFTMGTDPCFANQIKRQCLADKQPLVSDDLSIMSIMPELTKEARSPLQSKSIQPFLLEIKKTGGIAGENSRLFYNSMTRELVTVTNNNETVKQVSGADDSTARRVINDSGFFDSKTYILHHQTVLTIGNTQ